jgi:hypothetical protein
MALFLESNEIPQKNSDSVLAILEDLVDLTLDIASFNENVIQEEYNILTEEAEEKDKEEKNSGLLEKVKKFFIEFYRKIVALIGRVKQKLISIFSSKKNDENIQIYKSYHDYLTTVFQGIADVISPNAKTDDVLNWMDRVRFASKQLTMDTDIIEVKASDFNKMISDMENLSKTVKVDLEKMEAVSSESSTLYNLHRANISKYNEVLRTITRALSFLPKAFPKNTDSEKK